MEQIAPEGAAAAAAGDAVAAEAPLRGRRPSAVAAASRIAADAAPPSRADQLAERMAAKLPSATKTKRAAKQKRKRPPSPESGDDFERSASDSADDSHSAREAIAPTPAKRARAPATAPPGGDGDTTVTCKACAVSFPLRQVVDNFFCPCCQLIYMADGDSAANRLRLAKLTAITQPSPSTGGSSSVNSGQLEQNTTKPKLGSYEAELKRLLEAGGDPQARFQDAAAITHTDAIAGMRQSAYGGTSYQLQSQHLTNLIRSGHFKELTLALPVTNAEAQRRRMAEAKGGKVLMSQNGVLTSTADSMVERQLGSLQEFLKIVIVSILPSLFDRPRAALDWLELARSVINVAESPDGWPVALSYLTNLLSDRIPRGQPFNQIDLDLLRTERAMAPAASAAPRSGAPAGRADAERPRPEWMAKCVPTACREWNLGTCKAPVGQCRFEHICCWLGCGGADGHQGRDCPMKPDEAPRRPANTVPGSGGSAYRKRGAGGAPVAAAKPAPRK